MDGDSYPLSVVEMLRVSSSENRIAGVNGEEEVELEGVESGVKGDENEK